MWVRTNHYGWISAIVILGFTATGLFVLYIGFSGQSGVSSQILSDPVLETKLLGIFFILCPWMGLGILNAWIRAQNNRENRIQTEGIEKDAVLLEYSETGTYVNNSPKLLLKLEVQESDGSVTTREVKCIVNLTRIARIKPGMPLRISESPEGVFFHWQD